MPDILIVDDNPVVTMELEELLPAIGCTVAGVAHSGQQSVDMARKSDPDLALMDVAMLGEMDGITAAEILKRDFGIPVIFISIHTDGDLLDRAKKVKPLGYIHKPFSEEQITAAVKMALYKMDKEKEVNVAYDMLEQQVKDQSTELLKVKALLKVQSVQVAQLQAAADTMIGRLGGDKTQLEASMVSQLTELFVSLLNGLKQNDCAVVPDSVSEAVEAMLRNLITPFLRKLPPEYHAFTLTELRIAALLKEGYKSKEIAEILHLAPSTIIWYRKRIRRKLGIEDPEEMLVDCLPTIE